MTKNIFLSLSLLVFLSTPSFAGGELDDIKELVKKGLPNGQSPHKLGHDGDLLFGKKPASRKPPNTSLPLTRGTTFYVYETRDRNKDD